MRAGNIKGALLEYLMRKLLLKCGFNQVLSDNKYVYNEGDLFYINGKGSRHDADVLMEPPFQMPFSYPSRLLFECKAYEAKAGIAIVRNVLGLRYDINEFEIVTEEYLETRRNTRRSVPSMIDRSRYFYQVGVATVGEYTKTAIEFATNNKIPLISLKWILEDIDNLFSQINNSYTQELDDRNLSVKLKDFLKGKNEGNELWRISEDLGNEDIVIKIIRKFENELSKSYIGLLETGDMIFLYATDEQENNILDRDDNQDLKAKINYYHDKPNVWRLTVSGNSYDNNENEFLFYVPDRIFEIWKSKGLDPRIALNMKQKYFSNIFVFKKRTDSRLPFTTLKMDMNWFNNL